MIGKSSGNDIVARGQSTEIAAGEAVRSVGAGHPEEIELKLSLPAEAAARLRRHPTIRSLARRRSRSSTLLSTYFDTPDLALHRHGMALRIRRIGDRRVQTLKLPTAADGTLQVFREVERDMEGDVPDLDLIADEDVSRRLHEIGAADRLAPVFVTEIERRIWLLRLAESEIELALDIGEIRSGDRRLAVCEAELELKSGRRDRLLELALSLHGTVPFSLERRTKSARGYGLLADTVPGALRAGPVDLVRAMSLADAFAEIARSCLRQLGENEACVERGEDPEGVHQMRVAVRRMRALIGACRGIMSPDAHAWVAGELGWLQRQLGPAREWDVFVGETLEALQDRMPDDPAIAAMRREAAVFRDEAYGIARAAIGLARYTGFVLRMAHLLETGGWQPFDAAAVARPVAAFADATLQRRHKRLIKLGGKRADLDEPELHRLRLRAKKLRYAAEFLRSLYPRKPVKRYLAAVMQIQDVLGSLNDAVVSRDLLPELERRISAGAPDLSGRAVGIVQGWQAARIASDLRRFRGVWKSFRGCPAFWQRPGSDQG